MFAWPKVTRPSPFAKSSSSAWPRQAGWGEGLLGVRSTHLGVVLSLTCDVWPY